MANSVDPDQTAPIGAVCSGSTLFASILNLSVILGNYLQQTTSADDIFRCSYFCALRVKFPNNAEDPNNRGHSQSAGTDPENFGSPDNVFIMPPTLKKLKGHVLLWLVRPSIHPSEQKFS